MSAVRTLPVGKLPMHTPPVQHGTEPSIAGVVAAFLGQSAEPEPSVITGVHLMLPSLEGIGWGVDTGGVANGDADLATTDDPDIDDVAESTSASSGVTLRSVPAHDPRASERVVATTPRGAEVAAPETDVGPPRASREGARVGSVRPSNDAPHADHDEELSVPPAIDAVLAALAPMASVRLPPPAPVRPEHEALARLVTRAARAAGESPRDAEVVGRDARPRSLADVALASAEASLVEAKSPVTMSRPSPKGMEVAPRFTAVERSVGVERLRRALEGAGPSSHARPPMVSAPPEHAVVRERDAVHESDAGSARENGTARAHEVARPMRVAAPAVDRSDATAAAPRAEPAASRDLTAPPAGPSAPSHDVPTTRGEPMPPVAPTGRDVPPSVTDASMTRAAPSAPSRAEGTTTPSARTDRAMNVAGSAERADRRGSDPRAGEIRASNDGETDETADDVEPSHEREEPANPAFDVALAPAGLSDAEPRARAAGSPLVPRAPLATPLESLPPEADIPHARLFGAGPVAPDASTRVELRHPTLGALTLHLAQSDGGVGVEVGVRSLDAAIALHGSEARLRSELAEAGTDLRTFRVRTRRGAASTSDENRGGTWQSAARGTLRGR